ncbi:MAG: hypothetical protein LBQ50_09085 [Planctomycetaceae bacterium]|jgi:hypothetical protein|nr:hypothetical protein [Planctomycetaceae bacterium]
MLRGNRKGLPLQLKRTIILIRRTNDKGIVNILGHNWTVDKHWANRLVRAEIKLDKNCIEFYRLRRREPNDQPLLKKVKYRFPNKKSKR